MYTYCGVKNMTTHLCYISREQYTAVHFMDNNSVPKTYTPSYKIIQQGVYNTCYPLAFPLLLMADARLAMDSLEVCDL